MPHYPCPKQSTRTSLPILFKQTLRYFLPKPIPGPETDLTATVCSLLAQGLRLVKVLLVP